jgi:hypothetical protein
VKIFTNSSRMRSGLHGVPRLGIDRKIQTRREAHGAQQAQPILRQPGRRIADGSQHSRGQIRPAADVVDHLTSAPGRQRVKKHPVDGEIAPGGVFLGVGEMNRLGAASVPVRAIRAKAGDLDRMTRLKHNDHAEMRPHRHVVGEELLDILRPGVGGHVVVFWGLPEQHVPHAAAGVVGRESGVSQPAYHPPGDGFQRDAELVHAKRVSLPSKNPQKSLGNLNGAHGAGSNSSG